MNVLSPRPVPRQVTLVDVCSGNLRSVIRSFEHEGAQVTVADSAAQIAAATLTVVPGQGAFGPFVDALRQKDLRGPLVDAIARGVPYFGICLGMQALFEGSEEHGGSAGLGVLAGDVRRLHATPPAIKIPHMGWNQAVATRPGLLWPSADEPQHATYYFVHSFAAAPSDAAVIAATAEHGRTFCVAVERGRLFACQFHPEKSHRAGLALIRRFLEQP